MTPSPTVALEETAIQVGAPLIISLFQHIFDGIMAHKNAAATAKEIASTAAITTSNVVKTVSPTSSITPSTVTSIINNATAAGQTVLPLTNQFSDSLVIKDKVK